MKKIFAVLLLFFAFGFAQAQDPNDPDFELKDQLYQKYKKEVRAFDRKHFDDLFLEFFSKQGDANVTLTKEQFYTYTIKIAIYSEKYGLLYKKEKEQAQKSKAEWFARRYEDYLANRAKKP